MRQPLTQNQDRKHRLFFNPNREGHSPLSRAMLYALLLLVGIIMGTPFLWMLSTSIKPVQEILTFPPVWFPSELRWENYIEAWNAAPFARFYINSIFVATVQTALELCVGLMSAYAFARLRFPGRNVLFAAVLATLMIPNDVSLIPNYVTLAAFGWINTYWALILPSASNAFGTFLLRQHILGLPEELFDAAKIDGATHLHMLRYVVLPLSIPIIVTLILLSFVSTWNAYLWPLIVTNTADMRTLPIGLVYMRNEAGGNPWHLLMAASTFIVAPIILLFLFTQKHFLRGITTGAVKGG
jgi:sn-glycerol 3-phosphate transport system permease protein